MPKSPTEIIIPARDAYKLAATRYDPPGQPRATLIINAAMAVPRRFYRHYASFMAEQGYTVITYDYRGIGGSAPSSLRGFEANVLDWAEQDMAGVLDWAKSELAAPRLLALGHSIGGQIMALVPGADALDAMVTTSAQSGYWKMQGGFQKAAVFLHVHLGFPIMTRLFGYLPWSKFAGGEDLPRGIAQQWGGWCRNPRYVLGDPAVDPGLYKKFTAPILAYSFEDDNWGTRESVDWMMSHYANIERVHIIPSELGLRQVGHVGYFRDSSRVLWQKTLDWLEQKIIKA